MAARHFIHSDPNGSNKQIIIYKCHLCKTYELSSCSSPVLSISTWMLHFMPYENSFLKSKVETLYPALLLQQFLSYSDPRSKINMSSLPNFYLILKTHN